MQKQIVTLAALSAACLVCGCDALTQDVERRPVSVPGIATPEEVSAVGEPSSAVPQEPSSTELPPQSEPAQRAESPQQPERQGSIIGQTTDRLVDVKQALARNPSLEVSDGKVSGNDPLSQAGSVYNRASSVAGSAGLVQWIQHHKTLEDRYPTHAEVVAYMQQHGLKLPVLASGQMWAYNSDTGEIVTLRQR